MQNTLICINLGLQVYFSISRMIKTSFSVCSFLMLPHGLRHTQPYTLRTVGWKAEYCIFAATYCRYHTRRLPVPGGFTPTLSPAQALGLLILPSGVSNTLTGPRLFSTAAGLRWPGILFSHLAMCEAFVIC